MTKKKKKKDKMNYKGYHPHEILNPFSTREKFCIFFFFCIADVYWRLQL